MSQSIYDFKVKAIDGSQVSLDQYRGKTLLIVNTASECGFTPQYEGMQKIYESFRDKGFEVLAFPCNQFGAQEPGSESEIAEFCTTKYQTTFPLFAKIDVNGDNADPLYQFLKQEQPGILGSEGIKWNFTKFLVDGEGKVIERFAPQDTPEKIGEKLAATL